MFTNGWRFRTYVLSFFIERGNTVKCIDPLQTKSSHNASFVVTGGDTAGYHNHNANFVVTGGDTAGYHNHNANFVVTGGDTAGYHNPRATIYKTLPTYQPT